MTRWWDDAEKSRQVLDLVDGSDVVQGVGTAILAYHGLAAGVLEPLTRRTLMDVSAVRHALAGVDLAPVAKAMAAATSPVMGDAADQYGRLLAEDVHRAAMDSTEQLLLSLVSKGMPWPTAIERTATVHGVPLERLGKAAAALGVPAMPPLVRADLGDRALMDYAAHVGLREATEVEAVAKGANASQFEENEHPRGAGGRFVNAPKRMDPDTEMAERQARRQRRLNRLQRKHQRADNARRSMSAQEEQRDQRSLADIVMGVFGQKKEESSPVASLEAKRNARRAAQKDQMRQARRGDKAKPAGEQERPKPASGAPQKGEYRIEGERLAFVPREVADQIVAGKISGMDQIAAASRTRKGDSVLWMTPETAQKEIDHLGPDGQHYLLDMVLIALDGSIPVSEGGRRDETVRVAEGAKLRMLDTEADAIDAYDVNADYALHIKGNGKHPNPAWQRDRTVHIPILHLRVDNWQDWDAQGQDDGPPVPHDRQDLIDASKSMNQNRFEENEHPRGAKGRFANKPNRPEPDSEFQARQDRRARKQRKGRLMKLRRENAEHRERMSASPEAAALIHQAIAEDPLATDDTVESLTNRRAKRDVKQIMRSRRQEAMRAARKLRDDKTPDATTGSEIPDLEGKSLTFANALQLDALQRLGGMTGDEGMEHQALVDQINRNAYEGRQGILGMISTLTKSAAKRSVPVPTSNVVGDDGEFPEGQADVASRPQWFGDPQEARNEAEAYIGALYLALTEKTEVEHEVRSPSGIPRAFTVDGVRWTEDTIESATPVLVKHEEADGTWYEARVQNRGFEKVVNVTYAEDDSVWQAVLDGTIPEVSEPVFVRSHDLLKKLGASDAMIASAPDVTFAVHEVTIGQNDDDD